MRPFSVQIRVVYRWTTVHYGNFVHKIHVAQLCPQLQGPPSFSMVLAEMYNVGEKGLGTKLKITSVS